MVESLGWKDPLEKEMTKISPYSILILTDLRDKRIVYILKHTQKSRSFFLNDEKCKSTSGVDAVRNCGLDL